MKRFRIEHLTEYSFGAHVTLQPHRLLLRPRENHQVRITSSALAITPEAEIRWQRDALDNSVAHASFLSAGDRVRIVSTVEIEHYEDAPLDFVVAPHALMHPFGYAADEQADLAPFLAPSWANESERVQRWLDELAIVDRSQQTFSLLDRLNRIIHTGFRYRVREEPGVQSPSSTLALGSGSCRDFAALFIEACRRLGLASRFVSGYLHAPSTEAGDASTHAWAEVYLPGPGWKGFDPSTGELTGGHHIAVAVARHPEAVPPVSGSFVGPPNLLPSLRVAVRVSER